MKERTRFYTKCAKAAAAGGRPRGELVVMYVRKPRWSGWKRKKREKEKDLAGRAGLVVG